MKISLTKDELIEALNHTRNLLPQGYKVVGVDRDPYSSGITIELEKAISAEERVRLDILKVDDPLPPPMRPQRPCVIDGSEL